MRIALIQIGWDLREKFPAWAQEPLLAATITDPVLKESANPLKFKSIEGKEDVVAIDGWGYQFVVDIDKMPQIPFEVIATSKLTYRGLGESMTPSGTAPINERANVVVPGSFLSEVAEVKVACDCCTEVLGEEIKNGWRILAICVQPDQRRPDYVLGRKSQ